MLLAADASHDAEQSRASLLEEIGEHGELTLVRSLGNLGDELIRAGTHRLLEKQPFREIGVDELPSCTGDTVLLPGSGAWCRPYHEWMPRALAIAELRFKRVIVLPSSFDVSEDSVASALGRTRATVFAREPESLRRIDGLCRARFAHDCAFFYDYSAHRAPGSGTLNAFRADSEASPGEIVLADNDDISIAAGSLAEWLATIERHALVRTDRAHVMIAAALMGKQVEYAPASYAKLEALAAGSLSRFPVRQIAPPRRPTVNRPATNKQAATTGEQLRAAAVPPPTDAARSAGHIRVTAVILTRDRPDLAARAVHSVTRAAVPAKVLVIDNNSDQRARTALAAVAAADPRIELRLEDRNLGCAGARRLGVGLVDTDFILFLDDDAELIDGALEHMLADLDAHPDVAGVTPRVVGPLGYVQHCGGSMEVTADFARFGLDGTGLPFDDPSIPATGPSGWAPGTASLLRAEILRAVPVDDRMVAYYEDCDWCYRVEQRRPGSFRRCREALVLHHHEFTATPPIHSARLVERYAIVERLATQAHFYRATGLLLDADLAATLPELTYLDGSRDVAATRLLMELIAARGTDWTVMEWMNGGLDPLFGKHEQATRIVQLETDRSQLAAGTAQREAQVKALQAHADGLKANSAQLEAQVEALQAHANRVEANSAQLKAQVEALQAHADGLAAISAQLEAQVEALQAHADGLVTELSSARAESTAAKTALTATTAQMAAVEARAADLDSQLAAARAQEAQAAAQLAWLGERHLTLCKVEAGGWWRLRSHLLPLLRAAAFARSLVGKRTV